MDIETLLADGHPPLELPALDEALAAALTAQGEAGGRALGLLRDAARVLAGAGLKRPAAVAESCLRGAAHALLSLPGTPVPVGLKPAAAALLEAVVALAGPPSRWLLCPSGSLPSAPGRTTWCQPGVRQPPTAPRPGRLVPRRRRPPTRALRHPPRGRARTRPPARCSGYGKRRRSCVGT